MEPLLKSSSQRDDGLCLAELAVRREMDARDFSPEHLRILRFAIRRSFALGRVAFYFRSWRELGRLTDTGMHAHELMHGSDSKGPGLIGLKVFAPVILANAPQSKNLIAPRSWHWYRWNLNFLDWSDETLSSGPIWEEPSLPFEPELVDVLQQATAEELQRFSAGNAPRVATEPARERDAVSAPVVAADKNEGQNQSAPRPNSRGDSGATRDDVEGKTSGQDKKPDWDLLKRALDRGNVEEVFPVSKGVPSQGTAGVPQSVYPKAQGTLPGYSEKPNNDAGTGAGVPSQGTYPSRARALASLACTNKASLASVPPERTRRPEETEAAMSWLRTVDPRAMGIDRFLSQWEATCELYPHYVLNRLRGIYDDNLRRLKRGEHTDMTNPLAYLAQIAREEGRMRWR